MADKTPSPTQVVGRRDCPKCGFANAPTNRFCMNCGHVLSESEQQDAEERVPDAPPSTPTPPEKPPRSEPPLEADPAQEMATRVFVSEPVMDSGRLVRLLADGRSEAHDFDEQVVIGRVDSDVQLADDPFLSDRHARIKRDGGTFYLEDLDSANGTFVRLTEVRELQPEDRIMVGGQILEFVETSYPSLSSVEKDLGVGDDPWAAVETPGPRLVHIVEGGAAGEVYPLRPGVTHIGRVAGDLTFPDDPLLSGKHASIRVEETPAGVDDSRPRCTLKDEDSRNGVYLQVRGRRSLQHGDLVALGKQVLRFELAQPSGPMRRLT